MSNWRPQRALLSVTDKTNLETIASFLVNRGIELVSSGGTAQYLMQKGLPVTPVEQLAGTPEAFGGRMKTLSFNIMSGILFDRAKNCDVEEATTLGISPIDIVICNLYAFEDAVKKDASEKELVEKIDVGGPTMLRAAAKNSSNVLVLCDIADYENILNEWERDGSVGEQTRFNMAAKAFERTFLYDLAIYSKWRKLSPQAPTHGQALRYGENPHQAALVLPIQNHGATHSLAMTKPLQGKELSSNNLLDADAAWKAMSELSWNFSEQKSVCVVKHGNPCGMAVHKDGLQALKTAWQCDPVSAFGGILAFSFEIDETIAKFFDDKFIEVLIAPAFSASAREILKTKKNLRLLEVDAKTLNEGEWTLRSVHGGVLWQEEDEESFSTFKNMTNTNLSDEKIALARFGVIATKYLKSNCLALVDEHEGALRIAASGCGQPNRLDCLTLLIAPRARAANINVENCVLVSDAFFPFRDSIDAAATYGVKTIIQPGGSMRDQEVIEACNQHNIAMAFTGTRHFRH